MWVRATVPYNDLGLELINKRPEDPVYDHGHAGVVSPRGKRHVNRVACSLAPAYLLHKAGVREKGLRVLVHREKKDARLLIEYVHRSVACVGVGVEDQDPLKPVALYEGLGAYRYVVEHAPAVTVVSPRVVQASAHALGHLNLPPRDEVPCRQGGPDYEPHRSDGGGLERSVIGQIAALCRYALHSTCVFLGVNE